MAHAAEREVDLLTERRRHAGRRNVGGVREEIDARVATAALVGEDRRGDEGVARVGIRLDADVASAAVDPARVDPAPAGLPGGDGGGQIPRVVWPASRVEVPI